MNKFSIGFACCFLIFITFAGYLTYLPEVLVLVYWLLSLCTFSLYAFDKSRAKKGEWRIKEKHLHLLALAGGWPGALTAQQLLRHKSLKPSFRRGLVLTVLVNISVVIYMFSPQAREVLNELAESIGRLITLYGGMS
ncbi:DUF1294 domain-containing protein [Thalassomonas viridans]|uniref:DUF1294 domain-containing protein n=1 Tax=Thalassomonas viridans TaxID=137584 RepID=A0AAE9Z6X7_9GAMM|nr:DUF1294 domain-containing protein [Thalassomonas viridans]WDE07239.1 DUF1294 domain-containing protein [Thalassomonas viridans]